MNAGEIKLLKEGARHFGVDPDDSAIACFTQLISELTKWNKKVNLTSITKTTDIITKHILDSLSISSILPQNVSLVDIGSGGGFPSIPLKIVRPDIEVHSIDSVGKKILFQRHIARLLGFNRFVAEHYRAEELSVKMKGHFDYAVTRAVSNLSTVATLALPLIKEGGKIIAMKGRQGKEEIEPAADELAKLGLEVSTIENILLPGSNEERMLVVLSRLPENSRKGPLNGLTV